MWQITIEESPEGTSEQNYYEELRGPILQVRGRSKDRQLSFSSEKDDISDEEKYADEVLEPFFATTKDMDRRYITLKNEGTTVIRYQWLVFPPNNETEYLLANPAGSVVPEGYMDDIKRTRIGIGDEKVFKQPCLEFRFRKLPSVLLPGQSLEFPIIFRSTKPGYFYETLYLTTHPKLADKEGLCYSARLTGICMDPDLLETDSEGNDPRPENINELVQQITLEQEGKDLIDSILDHALFIEPEHESTLPKLRVTSESIFYTHNPNLKYYYEISEQALDTVSGLIEVLVPQERIEHNERLCSLSIESLYQLLWTRNYSGDLNWKRFKTEETENTLKKLADLSNVMIQPRRFVYPVASTRKIMASSATFLTIIDEILMTMEYMEKLYNTPELNAIYSQTANKKFETGRLYDRTVPSEWDFGSMFNQGSQEFSALNKEPSGEVDIIRESSVMFDPVKIEATKNELKSMKEKKKDRTKKAKTTIHKAKKTKVFEDDEDLKSIMFHHHENEEEGEEQILIKEVEFVPASKTLPPLTPSQIVKLQITEEKKRRVNQVRQIIFEDLLADGIERIICGVDAFNSMEDYRPSEFMTNKPSSSKYCCAD